MSSLTKHTSQDYSSCVSNVMKDNFTYCGINENYRRPGTRFWYLPFSSSDVIVIYIYTDVKIQCCHGQGLMSSEMTKFTQLIKHEPKKISKAVWIRSFISSRFWNLWKHVWSLSKITKRKRTVRTLHQNSGVFFRFAEPSWGETFHARIIDVMRDCYSNRTWRSVFWTRRPKCIT